jgi:hypothetical protein
MISRVSYRPIGRKLPTRSGALNRCTPVADGRARITAGQREVRHSSGRDSGGRAVNEDSIEPLEPWDHSWPAEIMEVLKATWDVVREDGDESDLVDRLVADHGEPEALRMLALIQVKSTRVSIGRAETMLSLKNRPGWKQRSCPTCGTVCDECLANAEEDLRNALGDLESGA